MVIQGLRQIGQNVRPGSRPSVLVCTSASASLAAFRDVHAVRDGRIYLLEGKHLSWYGPRIAGSLRYVCGLIEGNGA